MLSEPKGYLQDDSYTVVLRVNDQIQTVLPRTPSTCRHFICNSGQRRRRKRKKKQVERKTFDRTTFVQI